jgi:hypothetical protein
MKTPPVTHRLRVVRSRNWNRRPGWRWVCKATEAHPLGRVIEGFTADSTFTSRQRASSASPMPSSQSRAMDGARRHLIKYHLDKNRGEIMSWTRNPTVDLLAPGDPANPTNPAEERYCLNVQGTSGECLVIGTAEQVRAFADLVRAAADAAT